MTVNVVRDLHIARGSDLSQPAAISGRVAPHSSHGRHVQVTYDGQDEPARVGNVAGRRPPDGAATLAGLSSVTVAGGPAPTDHGGTPSLFRVTAPG